MLWRRRHLPNPGGPEAREITPPALAAPARGRRLPWVVLAVLVVAGGMGARWWSQRGGPAAGSAPASRGAPFATRTENGVTADFYSAERGITLGENDVLIEFRESAGGAPADVGKLRLDLDMNMPGMVMHSGSTVSPAGGTGRYRARFKPDMAGDWTAQLHYEGGPRGPGEMSFTVNVRP